MNRYSELENLLLTQLCHESTPDLFAFGPFTRRQFLLGASLFVSPLDAVSTNLGDPSFRWRGNALLVRFGDLSWTVDPHGFAAQASLQVQSCKDGAYHISLNGAVLPGTDIAVDFEARIFRDNANWHIAITLKSLGITGDIPLAAWMNGDPVSAPLPQSRHRMGSGHLHTPSATAAISSRDGLSLEVSADQASLVWTGNPRLTAERITLTRRQDGVQGPAALAGIVDRQCPTTEFCIHGATSTADLTLKGRRRARFRVDSFSQVGGDLFRNGGGSSSEAVLLEGSGAFSLAPGDGTGRRRPMRLKRAVLFATPDLLSFAGHPDQGQLIRVGAMSGETAAPDEQSAAVIGHIDGEAIHVSGSAAVNRLWTTQQNGDIIAFDFSEKPATIAASDIFGRSRRFPSSINDKAAGQQITTDALHGSTVAGQPVEAIDAGKNPVIDLSTEDAEFSLDDVAVTLRRGADLFNLTFRFKGFTLRRDVDQSLLIHRRDPRDKTDRVIIEFQPQHIWETIRPKPDRCAQMQGDSIARLAKPSRLAFQPVEGAWHNRPVSVESLSDWTDLQLLVNKRAQSSMANSSTQWELPGLDKVMGLTTALEKISAMLTPPSADETALELEARLIFSPAETATWAQQAKGMAPGTPLWNVRLEQGRDTVRAIWSSYFQPKEFPKFSGSNELLALDPSDHWQAVGQMSVPGLPALRRLDPGPSVPPSVADALKDIPIGGVIRPKCTIQYLIDVDTIQKTTATRDTGIAIATAFEDADISLSALGAIFRALWEADPPRLLPDPSNGGAPPAKLIPESFDLERLSLENWLGRDIRIIAVDKGFLFPLGLRASYVKISERKFYDDEQGHPVSYEVQHKFIVVKAKVKSYPALNQPDGGRDFPAQFVQLLTPVTPDLQTPDDSIIQAIRDIDPNAPIDSAKPIFWPQIKGKDGSILDFQFKWSTESASAVTTPLIFVDNVHIGVEAVMGALTSYYNRKVPESRRTARFYGGKQRYALEASPGDTSFTTDSWILQARGKQFGKGVADNFAMDGAMEGSDQPPFYPSVQQAKVTIQSVDRLIGTPQGLIKVAFHEPYLQDGFDLKARRSDIYLKVLGPRIAFDVTGQSQLSGGVASPTTLVAAISRKTGIVGGKEFLSQANMMAALTVSTDTDAGFDFQQADDGKFSIAEFFGFKPAKLLGILDFEDAILGGLLDQAPTLIETIAFGALEDSGRLDHIHDLANSARHSVDEFFDAFRGAEQNIDAALSPLTLQQLYPALVAQLNASTQEKLDQDFDLIASAASLTDIVTPATDIVTRIKSITREIENVLRNPIPAGAQDVIDQLQAYARLNQGLLLSIPAALSGLLAPAVAALDAAVCAALNTNQDLGGALFGASPATSCTDFLSNPADVLSDGANALFSDTIARTLANLLGLLSDLSVNNTKTFGFPGERVRALAVTLLEQAARQLSAYLLPAVQGKPDIRDPQIQYHAAGGIANRCTTLLTQLFQSNDYEKIAAAFVNARDRIEAEIQAEIASLNVYIFPDPASGKSTNDLLDIVLTTAVVPLRDLAIIVVKTEADRICKLIKNTSQELAADFLNDLIQALKSVIASVSQSAEFTRIARLGRQASGWCSQISQVTLGLCSGLIASVMDLTKAAQDASQMLSLLPMPQAPVPAPIATRCDVLRREILTKLDTFQARLRDLGGALGDLSKSLSQPICATPGKALDGVRLILSMRTDLVGQLQSIATPLAALDALLTDPSAAAWKKATSAVTAICADLVANVTSIARLSEQAPVIVSIRAFIASLKALDPYKASLVQHLASMEDMARTLRGELSNPSAAAFVLAAADARSFADIYDEKLAALVLQSVAMDDATIQSWEQSFASMVRGVAGTVGTLHRAMLDMFRTLMTELESAEAIVRFIIGNTAFGSLELSMQAIADDQTMIDAIAAPATSATTLAAAQALAAHWGSGQPAVVTVAGVITSFVEQLVSGNIPSDTVKNLQAMLASAEASLTEIIGDFLPTKIETSYGWATSINPVPPSDPIFRISDRQGTSPDVKDLTLSASVVVDLATGARSVSATGILQPFELNLLPDLPMATVQFRTLSFSSQNGSAPKFNVDVSNVVIGPLLKFLEPLEELMAPKGNGFFIRPAPNWPGLEAGYQFSAPVISLGPINFMNVALEIAARLPFGDHPAQFLMNFASAEHPFLIVYGVYAGGGYLALTMEPGGYTQLELSFVFGGAVPLKFGPLTAQASVLVGVGIRLYDKATTLWAIFEATGEGSIACFSIAVYLRITVWHYPTGVMLGEAEYGFSFKLGFVRFHYNVTARYSMGGGGGAAAPMIAAASKPDAHYIVNAPDKSKNWAEYRRYNDFSLL